MSFVVNASAEELAKLFHHYQEALADDFECKSTGRTPSWKKTSQKELDLKIAAVRMALLELAEAHVTTRREYFAAPGDAEWGC